MRKICAAMIAGLAPMELWAARWPFNTERDAAMNRELAPALVAAIAIAYGLYTILEKKNDLPQSTNLFIAFAAAVFIVKLAIIL